MKLTIPTNAPRAHTPGQFAACDRCEHSFERHSPQGSVMLCRAIAPRGSIYSPDIIPIGRARAVGMPCGPEARLAKGISTKLALERAECETSTGELQEFARKLGRVTLDPFEVNDMWGGLPS